MEEEDDVAGRGDVSTSPSAADACSDQSGYRPLSATSGYLAGVDADAGCPWLVRARPGQRVTVVAYDFGWPPAADAAPAPGAAATGGWPDLAAAGPGCPVFATLEERGTATVGRAVRLCEVRHRRTVVYSSLGHELVIRLQSTDANATAARGQRLFLHYEGTRRAPRPNLRGAKGARAPGLPPTGGLPPNPSYFFRS